MLPIPLSSQVIPGTVCSADVVKAHRKALNDLYRAQKADTALADLMENVPPPREAQLKDAMASLTRLKAQNRRKMFVDPGLNHPNRSQLTCAQLEQALQYGLLDGPGPPRRTAIIAPEVHLTVVAGLACMQRSDTVLNALMTNYFLMEAPTTEARGRQACVLLGVCSDDVRCWLRRVRLAPVLVVFSRPPLPFSPALLCYACCCCAQPRAKPQEAHSKRPGHCAPRMPGAACTSPPRSSSSRASSQSRG